MVTFPPHRCRDCGAFPGTLHQSWCPDAEPGLLHESSVEFELPPEKQSQEAADDSAASSQVATSVTIDRACLDLEALRPFFTDEALQRAVWDRYLTPGNREPISGVEFSRTSKHK